MGKNIEVGKWMRQSNADLKSAEDSLKTGHFEWACFQAQQAAEKAFKAYLYNLGLTSVMTHSLRMLIKECEKKEKSFSLLEEAARFLDNYYIPTRYPNGLSAELAPAEYYDKGDAEKCLNYAASIYTACKKFIKI